MTASQDIPLRAQCFPGTGPACLVTVGLIRAADCGSCGADTGVPHALRCASWLEHGCGLPQYAPDGNGGCRPIPAAGGGPAAGQ